MEFTIINEPDDGGVIAMLYRSDTLMIPENMPWFVRTFPSICANFRWAVTTVHGLSFFLLS